MSYVGAIAESRYFWFHLAKSELRSRFRYSKLGILWALAQPLMITVLYTVVFGSIFKRNTLDFATFVLSGLITWELLSGAVMAGSLSLLSAESYIRQRHLPYAIYPLRTALVLMMLFCVAFCGLALWAIIYKPANFGLAWTTLPLSFACLFLIVWPTAVISAFFHTKFRDFQQVMVLVVQTIYYVSPVFLDPEMFKAGNLTALLNYNPVAHILNLIRAPVIHGEFPTLANYGYTLGAALVLSAIASWKIRREEATLIFYF
jgi:lipopolysaccharide transport system permease protein